MLLPNTWGKGFIYSLVRYEKLWEFLSHHKDEMLLNTMGSNIFLVFMDHTSKIIINKQLIT